jgi:hypothetical protein
MISNRIAFASLAVACVIAAGGGGYLATRTGSSVSQAAAAAPESPAAIVEPARPVQETEAVIAEVPPPAVPARASAAGKTPRPERRASTPSASSRQDKSRTRRAEPALDRTWPASASNDARQAPTPPATLPSANTGGAIASNGAAGTGIGVSVPEPAPLDLGRPVDPPEKTMTELVVSSESVIGLQNDTSISTDRARVEDRVEAHVARDVRVGGEVAIPAGSRVLGSVMVVERGGRFKERARLGIRFHTLVLGDGTRLPITTDTIYRYGDEPGNKSAAKIGGGAVAGAILGAIIGGAKGAAVGATAGAGGGTAAVMAGDRGEAAFPAGAEVTARILSPVTVTVER